MFDPSKVEKIAPEFWRNSVFSIARHYGSIIMANQKYVLDPETDYLVRLDIWQKESKGKEKAEAEKKKWIDLQQADLFRDNSINLDAVPF